MLRRVELDATRDPGPEQAYEGGLDDALPVKEVVSVGDVLPDVNPTSNLRKDHQPDVAVLEMDGLPGPIDLFVRHAIGDRIRIHATTAALVDALFQEHRAPLRRLLRVRGDDDLVMPGADLAHVHPLRL